VQRTIGEALGAHDKDQDSPVMNETLNVIDEHITDLSTPRQSLAQQRLRRDSGSEYSSHVDRRSFVAGPETDEEDNAGVDEPTVRSWDHLQTAQHLRDIGVDPKHCDIFAEQEISGDVLLDMDQNFIYMKEFDFGVMGRRLKTWHKIRDFQRDVKSTSTRTSERGQNNSMEDINRPSQSQSRLVPPLHLTPSITEEPSDIPHPLQPSQSSKRTSWAGAASVPSWRAVSGPDSLQRTNTATSRHSQRPSSIDFGAQPDLELSSVSAASHKKQPSTDRTWSITGSTQATTPASSIKPTAKPDDRLILPSPTPTPYDESSFDFDRGYFSGNELDNRKLRDRPSKTSHVGHSRQTSLVEQSSKRTSMMKRHNRLSSVDSVHEPANLNGTSNSAARPKLGRVRSTSLRATSFLPLAIGMAPSVTNLENDLDSNIGSPSAEKMRLQDRAKKIMGFRSTSDAVTSAEKTDSIKATPYTSTAKSSELLASPATGGSIPSTTPSIDIDTPEAEAAVALTKNNNRPKPSSKQRTSAYTHGLLKMPPSEARNNCDHYGWMKKKSSSIMATWKPRLFILRGRRLSYYYSESDTEERGIIDISGHKVLAANDDPTVTIHASVTGANKAGSTPKLESEASSLTESTVPSSLFYFKLVPPKGGLSRAVQFTKPAIHYFQVDSLSEGRKWMGEIMKATIEHDLSNLEMTNKQATISLAKARANRERPPSLNDTKKADKEKKEAEKAEKARTLQESGLGIEFADSAVNLGEDKVLHPAPPMAKPSSTLGMIPRASASQARLTEEAIKRLSRVPEENKENASSPVTKSPKSPNQRKSRGSTDAWGRKIFDFE